MADPERVSDLRKRRHLVSQDLPKPCVGSRRSVRNLSVCSRLSAPGYNVFSRSNASHNFSSASRRSSIFGRAIRSLADSSSRSAFPVPRREYRPTECLRQRRLQQSARLSFQCRLKSPVFRANGRFTSPRPRRARGRRGRARGRGQPERAVLSAERSRRGRPAARRGAGLIQPTAVP